MTWLTNKTSWRHKKSSTKRYTQKKNASRNCVIEQRHEDEYFNNENPFIIKLTINEKDEIEGPITLNECACVLRNIKMVNRQNG